MELFCRSRRLSRRARTRPDECVDQPSLASRDGYEVDGLQELVDLQPYGSLATRIYVSVERSVRVDADELVEPASEAFCRWDDFVPPRESCIAFLHF